LSWGSGGGDGDLVKLPRWRLCKRLTVNFVVGIGKWRQRPCQPASLEIVRATYCDFRRGNREVGTATLSSCLAGDCASDLRWISSWGSGSGDSDLVNLHRWRLCERLTVIFVVVIGKWRRRPCQPGRLAQIPRETPCTINHEHWSTMNHSCFEKHEQTICIGEQWEPCANHEQNYEQFMCIGEPPRAIQLNAVSKLNPKQKSKQSARK